MLKKRRKVRGLAGRSSGRRVSAASRGGSGCERLELDICRSQVWLSGWIQDKLIRERPSVLNGLPTWVFKLGNKPMSTLFSD